MQNAAAALSYVTYLEDELHLPSDEEQLSKIFNDMDLNGDGWPSMHGHQGTKAVGSPK